MRILLSFCLAALSCVHLHAQQTALGVDTQWFNSAQPGLRAQQPPPQMTCAAEGTVVNAATGEPVSRATVLVSVSGTATSASTDAQGRWTVTGAGCGFAQFNAQKPGFTAAMYGQAKGNQMPKPINLQDGSPVRDIKIALAPQAVVTGKVVDENGEPVMGAQVQVITSVVQEGKRMWQPRNGGQTDDLGQYRLHSLMPGKYIVCAQGNGFGGGMPGKREANIYTETCFPGPPEGASVAALDVVGGRETKVDFALTPRPGVTLKGTIAGLSANNGAGLMLRKRGLQGMGVRVSSNRVNPDGTFEITGVAPGSYILQANAFTQQRRVSGETAVDVGTADIEGISLAIAPGFEITGTLRTETTKPASATTPAGAGVPGGMLIGGIAGGAPGQMAGRAAIVGPNGGGPLNLMLRSVDGMFGGGQMKWNDDKTSFTMSDVMPGRYVFQFNSRPGYYVKSITLNGQDLLDQEVSLTQATGPIEVVLSDEVGSVEGNLTAADGTPATGSVLLMPDKGGAPRPIHGFAGPQGNFKFPSVPPGNYNLYAWSDVTQAEYANPDWMRQFGASGVRVTVAAGQTAKADAKQIVLP